MTLSEEKIVQLCHWIWYTHDTSWAN